MGKNRAEYLDAISQTDFMACPRGDANQSARFYETLSAGRIPLIRNSSVHQPSSLVSSRETISPGLIVPTLVPNLHKKVMENWLQIGDSNSYRKQQLELREYYEREISFIPFMRRMFLMDFSEFLLCAR